MVYQQNADGCYRYYASYKINISNSGNIMIFFEFDWIQDRIKKQMKCVSIFYLNQKYQYHANVYFTKKKKQLISTSLLFEADWNQSKYLYNAKSAHCAGNSHRSCTHSSHLKLYSCAYHTPFIWTKNEKYRWSTLHQEPLRLMLARICYPLASTASRGSFYYFNSKRKRQRQNKNWHSLINNGQDQQIFELLKITFDSDDIFNREKFKFIRKPLKCRHHSVHRDERIRMWPII